MWWGLKEPLGAPRNRQEEKQGGEPGGPQEQAQCQGAGAGMSLGCRGKQVMRGRGTPRCPGPPMPSSDCSQPRAAGQSRDRWVKRHVEKTQKQRAGGSEAGMQTGPALLPGMRAAALRGQLELDTWEGDWSAVDNTLLHPWARCVALGWEEVAGFHDGTSVGEDSLNRPPLGIQGWEWLDWTLDSGWAELRFKGQQCGCWETRGTWEEKSGGLATINPRPKVKVNGQEFEQTPEDSEGQGSLACCSPWGRKG